jgi:hypothetical protein
MEKWRALIISALVLLTTGFVKNLCAQSYEKTVIDRFISRQADDEEAEEYKEARKILRGDVNGDRLVDVVVLYTLEGSQGSNNYLQYIAVFVTKGRSIVYAAHDVVGGKNTRGIRLRSVAGSRINLDTVIYKNGNCCAGRKVKAVLVLRRGKLVEL